MQKFSFLRGCMVFLSKKKLFFMQNFTFCGAGCSFWFFFLSIFCHFSCKISIFLRGWEVLLSKKRQFFHAKLQFLRGWVVFLSNKTTCALLHAPWSPAWKSSRPTLSWWQQNQWKKKGLRRDGGAQTEGACESVWSAQAASERAKRAFLGREAGNSEAMYGPHHKPGSFCIKNYQSTDRPWHN